MLSQSSAPLWTSISLENAWLWETWLRGDNFWPQNEQPIKKKKLPMATRQYLENSGTKILQSVHIMSVDILSMSSSRLPPRGSSDRLWKSILWCIIRLFERFRITTYGHFWPVSSAKIKYRKISRLQRPPFKLCHIILHFKFHSPWSCCFESGPPDSSAYNVESKCFPQQETKSRIPANTIWIAHSWVCFPS